jgi:hypothetical protein
VKHLSHSITLPSSTNPSSPIGQRYSILLSNRNSEEAWFEQDQGMKSSIWKLHMEASYGRAARLESTRRQKKEGRNCRPQH